MIDDSPTRAPDLRPKADEHSLGPRDASITLIEYAEFECPHCGRAHFHLKQLRDRLDELDTRFVFRHFARDDVNPFSVRAAVTAEAAARQGRFWEMHDRLFQNQHALEYEDLKIHAAAVGLDLDRFLSDLADPMLVAHVEAQSATAASSGLSGTPSFFLNERVYAGPYDVDSLIRAIQSERDALGATDPVA